MIDKLRFHMSAVLIDWAIKLIPYEPVRIIFRANVLNAARQLQEGLAFDGE